MLKPAQLYADQLRTKIINTWYKPEYIYWTFGTSEDAIELPDNNGRSHCFVSVDKDGNVIGYICYEVDWLAMSASGWGMLSFQKGSVLFAKDVYQAICDCFEVFHMNRIHWSCAADNPAIRGYRNFIKRHGGVECGHYRQETYLRDGKLHDTVDFEILAEEFRR